jgi:hypothetical protein
LLSEQLPDLSQDDRQAGYNLRHQVVELDRASSFSCVHCPVSPSAIVMPGPAYPNHTQLTLTRM